MSENRPLVVKEYAKDWDATKKWGDDGYLAMKAGRYLVNATTFRQFEYVQEDTVDKEATSNSADPEDDTGSTVLVDMRNS